MLPAYPDLEVAAKRLAWLAPQPRDQNGDKVPPNRRMGDGTARHGDRREAVELVLKLLPVLPVKELVEAHVPSEHDVHDHLHPTSGGQAPPMLVRA
jgi:hypothetical protein